MWTPRPIRSCSSAGWLGYLWGDDPVRRGWGEDGALEAVTEFATLIDSLARKVENAITTTIETVDSDELARAVIA